MTDYASPRSILLNDLFVTALEGGISYWSEARSYHWSTGGRPDYTNFYAEIVDFEDGDRVYRIDRSVISRGYKLATTTHADKIGWSTDTPPFIVTQDCNWDFDASDADAIVQLGLFGDVVYG